jgi:hypothetical protein
MLEVLNTRFLNYYAYFAQKLEIFVSVVEGSSVSSFGMFISEITKRISITFLFVGLF